MSPDESRDLSPWNPLHERYASAAMKRLFSARHRFLLWRRLWITLAECQKELGLAISDRQLAGLREVESQLDLQRVSEIERETRHDVVAHLRHFAEQAGEAGRVLHLGATSAFITDNSDVVLIREALEIVGSRLGTVIRNLAAFSRETRSIATLAYTHLQPAQLTTIGKRACLWLQDFLTDLEELRRRLATLRLRGVKGTTGTQASYLSLFDGDQSKVVELDRLFAERLEFAGSWPLTGQTYPRKQDSQVLASLAGIAESAHKMGTDLRLLQGIGVLSEPFRQRQVGSSAMAYKRNPIRAERMCALARRVMIDSLNGPFTAATQWLERSLDDSANRRLVIPDAFFLTDAVLLVAAEILAGLEVHPAAVEALVRKELPFMATETILVRAVQRGGDRQALHERLRQYSMAAHSAVERGEENPLLARVASDPDFNLGGAELEKLLDPQSFVGRAPQQVDEYLDEVAKKDLPEDSHKEELRV
jgi:adenylosuccinate lyase